MSWWADISGIVGLVVGVVGLAVTVWTFWKVKSIKGTLDFHKRKRVFKVRLLEHYRELESYALRVSSGAFSRKNIDVAKIVEIIAALEKLCDNVISLDTDHRISPEKLINLRNESVRFMHNIPSDQQLAKELLKSLSPLTNALKEEVRVFLDNVRAEIEENEL